MVANDALYGVTQSCNFTSRMIDPEKHYWIMGFSWGGSSAVYTGLDMIRKPIIDDENSK